MVVAAVAAGAFVAAGQGMGSGSPALSWDDSPVLATGGGPATGAPADDALPDNALADDAPADAGLSQVGVGGAAPAPEVLPLNRAVDTEAVEALAKGERIVAERAAREAEAQPAFVLPAEGAFTSGFGARWGTTHFGIDVANGIGTPIYAAADGIVLETGPASGFGLWIRLGHPDGTTTVYGHINRSLVEQGQQVRAGDVIAEMGNRGQSTGSHLHFEVWEAGGQKVDPLQWLGERGIGIGA